MTNPQRVLLCAYQCAPGGGSVSHIGWEWAHRLAAQRPVTLITHQRNRSAIESTGQALDVIYIDTEWLAGPLYRVARWLFPKSEHGVFMLSSLDFFLFDFLALKAARKRAKEWALVHVVTPVTLSAPTQLFKLPCPLIRGPINCGLPWPSGMQPFLRFEPRWLIRTRLLGRLLDRLIGASAATQCFFVASSHARAALPPALRARAVHLLENAVDPRVFAPSPWPSDPPPLRVLFVGRLIKLKALDVLIDAIAQLKPTLPITLTVVGEGDMRAEWEAQSQQRGITAQFVGALPAPDVAAHMARHHVLCLPSVRESGGAVLIEAMACARPVIAVRFGGPADLVDDHVGRNIAPGNRVTMVAGFAQALEDVARHPAEWAAKGQHGAQRVARDHTWDAKIARAQTYYQRAIKDYQKPPHVWLVSRYPDTSHTFILNEIDALSRQGFAISPVSINTDTRAMATLSPAEQRARQHTFYLKPEGIPGALLAHGATLAQQPRAYLAGLRFALSGHGPDVRGLTWALFHFTEALMLARWMRAKRAWHLHVHFATAAASVATIVRAMSPIKLSISVHGPDEFSDCVRQRLRQKIARADAVVCISDFTRSQLMLHTDPHDWPKIAVRRLGVDVTRFHPGAQPPEPFHMLCVARLAPPKGHGVLLRAARILVDQRRTFHLTLIGDGPLRAALEAQVCAEGLAQHVSLPGARNQDALPGLLHSAHVFVLASFAEGLPVVLMEAMASGVPVVASHIAGIPELISHGDNGLLFAPGNAEDLAAALADIMDRPRAAATRAAHARDTVVQKFDAQHNYRALADWFRSEGLHA